MTNVGRVVPADSYRGALPLLNQSLASPCRRTALRSWLAAALATATGIVRAEQRWYDEQTTGPFQCHADFSLANHTELLEGLGQLQHDLTRWLEVSPARETVHLFLFYRKQTYQAYLKAYFPRVPYRRALFIKERGPGMVLAFLSNDLDVDLRHESTHALLHAVLPQVPLWLDEGLAEYFELPSDRRAGGNPYLTSVRWQARLNVAPRLEDLEAITDLERLGQVEYRNSWAWVHFLLHGPPEARQELISYLSDLQAPTAPPPLSDRLRRRWSDLDQRFTQHFRQWKS